MTGVGPAASKSQQNKTEHRVHGAHDVALPKSRRTLDPLDLALLCFLSPQTDEVSVQEAKTLASLPARSFLVGTAKRDITPLRDGLWLAGHNRARKSEGVRDPLSVRTLYLSDGKVELSLNSLDLVGLRKIHVDEIRGRVQGIIPADGVLVFATHTHSGPDTIGYWGPRLVGCVPLRSGIDPEYLERVQSQTVATIQEARDRAVPARAFAACAEMPPERTRNLRRDRFKEDNIYVLQFLDERGETVGVLSNYPCHPEMLGRDNLRVSADFVADVHRVVEAELGGLSIFLQQALGGMGTGGALGQEASLDASEGDSAAKVLGQTLGDGILEAIRHRRRPIDPLAPIRFVRREFTVPFRNRRLRLACRLGLLPASAEELRGRMVRTETSWIEFGPVRMVTVPGEPLPEVGFQIQAILNCPYPFVLSLGCDELGYILPRQYAGRKAYRYENSMSLGPDLTEKLLEELRQMVLEGT